MDSKCLTRSKIHVTEMEIFLNSKLSFWPIYLYGKEIKKLEEMYPVIITKKSKKGSLYECLVYKRRK